MLTTILAEIPWLKSGFCNTGRTAFARSCSSACKKLWRSIWRNPSTQPSGSNWLPGLPKNVLHLLEQVDVVLDSWPVGGGSTVFTCLGLGIPLVSWASPFFRGRVAQGAYQYMGIAEAPVADNAKDAPVWPSNWPRTKTGVLNCKQRFWPKNAILFRNPASLAEFSNLLSQQVLSLRAKSV